MTESSRQSTEREYFPDLLRVAASCAVVLLHTVTGVVDTTDMSGFPVQKTVFLILLDWITWCVPVFVMISGYLFLNPQRQITWKQMLRKYCRRIVLALFLFGMPYAYVELFIRQRSFQEGMIGQAFLMVLRGESWSHMWYLYLILFLYLITPLLKKILAVLPDVFLYAAMALLAIGSSILPFLAKWLERESLPVLPDGGIYLFYYLCGYLFARKSGNGRDGQPQYLLSLGRMAILTLLAGMTCSRLIGNYSVQMAYNYPFTVILSLLLFAVVKKGQEKKAPGRCSTWMKEIAHLSFAIYLIHPVFLNVFYKFLHMTPLDFSLYWSLPLFWMLAMSLSVMGAWMLEKIPFFSKYVL